jgi:fibro-slime domain-containing protein
MKNSVCLKRLLVILAFGCHTLFAQAVTFYFLPPDNDNWVAGNSYLYDGDKKTAELMQVDTRCGWFKKVFPSVSEVPEKALIYLGSLGRDKLDLEGTGADSLDPAWIRLRTRFGTSNTALYFYQDLSDGDSDFRFRTTAPPDLGEATTNRCSYKMAAFIYDTDNSVNPSFSGTYCSLDPTSPAAQRCPGLGTVNQSSIRRGIVAPTLDTTTRKPTFAAAAGYANWKDAASFDAAFTPEGLYDNKVSNVPRCYDMPFGRATNGIWEFDSDNMRPPNSTTNLVGGFFPYILDSLYSRDEDGTDADYTKCPTCRKEYNVTCFSRLGGTALNNLAPVTWRDSTYRGADAFDRTRFPDGTGLGNYYAGTAGCQTTRPGFDGATKSRANLSFCFESHAQFVYEKGQEFFFRGDDDIWVFINNRLVIDLGGVHNAAPGYVDLDTISVPEPLVEGNKYPIDIFFCERMATQSNVRVSTNMYIVQKTTFYNEPERADNWMCASISSGNDCGSKMGMVGGQSQENLCGNDLIAKGAYTVDFYMIRRSDRDTVWLSGTKNNSNCQGGANEFTCYKKDGIADGGITVNNAVYSCGGRGKCKGNQAAIEKVDVPSGNYTVYARLMDSQSGKPVAGSKPLIIDNLKSTTSARIVWGELNSEDGNSIDLENAYEEITKMNQAIIAGKRTPIYIAAGHWTDTKRYTSFDYIELDPTDPADIIEYSLSGTAGLKIYKTSNPADQTIHDGRGTLPPSGIDTLWVEGDFSMGEMEFTINLAGVLVSEDTPSLKLTVYQPVLKFTDSTLIYNPRNPITPSGFRRWTNDTLPPYVDKALDVYVVAWDSLRYELCTHCNFILRETSTTNNKSINNVWQNAIVQSDAMKIENGKQIIYMRGRDVVWDTSFAKWRIYGPSENFTFAEWNKLQFRDAPIPMPLESFVYDRNGDGIGDSLVIKFSKPFKNDKGKIIDSLLPVLIEVTWEQGYTVAYHNRNYSVDNLKKKDYVMNLYKSNFFEENRGYWEKYLKGDSLIVIADSNTAFSKNILTSGKGSLLSYTPFNDPSKCGNTCGPNAFTYAGYEAPVLDRISPIVVRAVYTMDNTKNCADKSSGCRESLVAYLSEPIFAVPDVNDPLLIKNPFSYCFEYSQNSKCSKGDEVKRHDQSWNSLNWKWELPQEKNTEDTAHLSTYKPNNKTYPKEYYDGAIKGDSIVELIYYARKTADGTTRMPKATDWIKIRWPSSSTKKGGVDVFYDAEGNSANPREIGVLISGTNYYKKEQIKISAIDKNATPDDPPLGGIFSDINKPCPTKKKDPCATWIDNREAKSWARDHLFQADSGHVTAFLPIPKGYPLDSAKANYPGSVGTIFDIATTINNEVANILAICDSLGTCRNKNGRPLTSENIAEGITMHASVYYHTNLGNYTAHMDPVLAYCTDKIFQKEVPKHPENGNNCWGNEYNFYLAWDLKTNKNRFVGTGAYVAITKFYWQIEYKIGNDDPILKKFNQDEFVEMFGVRRSKEE